MAKFPYYEDWQQYPYRRGVYREPFYSDSEDYNTNAKSYYDYLARFNGFLHQLVDFVNDLADRLDDLEDRVDKLEDRVDKLEDRMDKVEDKVDKLGDGLQKIIDNLYDSGAIDSKDPSKFEFKKDRNIATGNINVFSDKTDGQTFIRTANGKLDKDVTIGYTKK